MSYRHLLVLLTLPMMLLHGSISVAEELGELSGDPLIELQEENDLAEMQSMTPLEYCKKGNRWKEYGSIGLCISETRELMKTYTERIRARKKVKTSSGAPHPETNNYFGVLAGNAFITSTVGGNAFIFGVRAGAGVLATNGVGIFSIGTSVGFLSRTNTVSGAILDSRVTALELELITRRCWGSPLYLGGRFGLGLYSLGVTVGTVKDAGSFSSLLVGPVLGIEMDMSPLVSFVLDASWHVMGAGDMTTSRLGVVPVESTSAILLQAGLIILF